MTSHSMENNLAVVTLHDAAPAFSKRIFEYTDAFENLANKFQCRTYSILSSYGGPWKVSRIRG